MHKRWMRTTARMTVRAMEFRHPRETLKFFGIKPTMTVGEYGPGGGWYTRVLAPWLAENGTYVAINADVETYYAGSTAERNAERKRFPETFPGRVAEWTGIDQDRFHAVEIDEAPDWAGKLDAFLMFRSLHGLARENLADDALAHAYGAAEAGRPVRDRAASRAGRRGLRLHPRSQWLP